MWISVRMIVTALIPLFPLRIRLSSGADAVGPIAFGPEPGAPQVIGPCTPSAWGQGVRPGLRVGEALARCPGLNLLMPDPRDHNARLSHRIPGGPRNGGQAPAMANAGAWRPLRQPPPTPTPDRNPGGQCGETSHRRHACADHRRRAVPATGDGRRQRLQWHRQLHQLEWPGKRRGTR